MIIADDYTFILDARHVILYKPATGTTFNTFVLPVTNVTNNLSNSFSRNSAGLIIVGTGNGEIISLIV